MGEVLFHSYLRLQLKDELKHVLDFDGFLNENQDGTAQALSLFRSREQRTERDQRHVDVASKGIRKKYIFIKIIIEIL